MTAARAGVMLAILPAMLLAPETQHVSLQRQTPVSLPLRRLEWVWIAAVAILLRAGIFATVCLHTHLSLEGYARLYDGNSYLITAAAMLGNRSEFNDFHGRVFPGFPAMIAMGHLIGFPPSAAALGIDWISAAAAAVLAGILFADRRVGWAMVVLFPHYLMNSSLAMSEAPLLAFTLAGLLMIRWSRTALGAPFGGAIIGIAGLIRPMACFALLGSAFGEWLGRSGRSIRSTSLRILTSGTAAGMVVLAGLLLVQHWRGDALANARYYASSPNTYDGRLLTWPFHSLLTTPGLRQVPIARVLYIWAHALLALMACGVLLRRFLQQTSNSLDWRDALAGPWLWTTTLFALCTGSIWGFECFHRFLIPALPALFWAIRRVLPQRPAVWLLIAVVSTTTAVLTVTHDYPGATPAPTASDRGVTYQWSSRIETVNPWSAVSLRRPGR